MEDPKQTARSPAATYARCAKLALELLQPRLNALFESTDDALFDLAEKADSNAQQTQFFEGMREVRKKRSVVERTFRQQLQHNLEAYRKGTPATPQPEAAAPREAGMSLVEDRELEEELAVSEMIAKGENRLAEPLYALNQRFGALFRLPPPTDEANPLGPASLCHAFRRAAQNFDVETAVLIVVYKLFDKLMVSELASVYAGINKQLVADGVLPRLRTAGKAKAPPGSATATAVASDTAADLPAAASSHQPLPELAATVLELLSGRRTTPRIDDRSTLVGTPDLLNALHLLQAEPARVGPLLAGGGSIKGVVLDQAARLNDVETPAVSDNDEDCIDLVAMMFEFILQDRNLPDAMQVLLSRLQIPFLKAALLDRRVFARRDHPARRLLDALAESSVGWSRETDRGQRLYNKVSEVVEAVIREFDDDVATFERLAEDFEDFRKKTKRRAQVAEKRTTEATQGQERLQRSRERAAQEINTRVDQSKLPPLIEDILRKPWANALVLIHLRHGEQSAEFKQGVKFVDELMWTAQPKATSADVARLQSMLPHLAAQLRAGLAMVAYQEADIAKVFKSLKQLYRSMIDSQYREHLTMPGMSAPPKPESPPPLATSMTLPPTPGGPAEDVIAKTGAKTRARAPVKIDADRLQWIKDLEVGTWFEFSDEGGKKIRAKLSWKSPITSKFLLVDQKGIKVADKPLQELAQEIVTGETLVLETVPLFQRALGAIAERLREEKPVAVGESSGKPAGTPPPSKGAG